MIKNSSVRNLIIHLYLFFLEEFAANVYWALHNDPLPLSKDLRYILSWEAATDRLIDTTIICFEEMARICRIGYEMI